MSAEESHKELFAECTYTYSDIVTRINNKIHEPEFDHCYVNFSVKIYGPEYNNEFTFKITQLQDCGARNIVLSMSTDLKHHMTEFASKLNMMDELTDKNARKERRFWKYMLNHTFVYRRELNLVHIDEIREQYERMAKFIKEKDEQEDIMVKPAIE